MTDVGLLHYFLTMEVYQLHGAIFLSQHRYLQQLLETYGLIDCKYLSCLMESRNQAVSWRSPLFEDCTKYRRLIGSLIHLTYTRPDVSYSVTALGQFSNAPCQVQWRAAICVLWYIACMDDYGLPFRGCIQLIGYSNADWAGDADTRRLT